MASGIQPGDYVVVTTSHRGVFAGVFVSREEHEVVLTEARVCVYWSAKTRGFVGLAVTGPLDGSRVSPACERIILPHCTCVLKCSHAARQQWESVAWPT